MTTKKKEISGAAAFVDAVNALGLDGVVEYVSTACEIAGEVTEGQLLGRAWRQIVPDLTKLARRIRRLEERAASCRRWETASPQDRLQGEFIGAETTYLGGEWAQPAGTPVRIDAVLRQGDDSEVLRIKTNTELRVAGGVSARDRIEVRAVKSGGQLSFLAGDPYALDLECFAALRRPSAAPG